MALLFLVVGESPVLLSVFGILLHHDGTTALSLRKPVLLTC